MNIEFSKIKDNLLIESSALPTYYAMSCVALIMNDNGWDHLMSCTETDFPLKIQANIWGSKI